MVCYNSPAPGRRGARPGRAGGGGVQKNALGRETGRRGPRQSPPPTPQRKRPVWRRGGGGGGGGADGMWGEVVGGSG